MGQAKLRGTKEQRKAEAIEAAAAAKDERERLRAAHWAALTPEQRKAERARHARVAALMGIVTSVMPFDLSPEAFSNRYR